MGFNIVSPAGFKACGEFIGLKKQKKDLCLIASETPATAAACFTKNTVKAAPVVYDQKIIESGKKVRGIIVNSGNANACTGEKGMEDTGEMAGIFAGLLGARADEVLVCSTGVIGVPLPMDVIRKGIPAAFPRMGGGETCGADAVQAIMTTDTFPKTCGVSVTLGGKKATVAGMAKGSGMIHPDMATLLAFVTTDAAISQPMLQKALSGCVSESFNMVSVDGDTSTNDTIIALANGMAGNGEITGENADYEVFCGALGELLVKLAKDVAKDGEGATKLLEIRVTGAESCEGARLLARSVASSNLFKAMMFGADTNWGRVMCAMGYSGAAFDPEKVTMNFTSAAGRIELLKDNAPIGFDEADAKRILSEPEIVVEIELSDGAGNAVAWGCDLTYDYVKINGDYRS